MTKYLLLVAATAVALVAYLSMMDDEPPHREAPNPAHVRNTGEWGTSR